MGKRRGGGQTGREDQYGEAGTSQDADERFQFSSKSSRGGGSAGSQTRHKAGHDLSYQRHVPKFLQKYSHLLGKGAKGAPGNEDGADEDEPVVANAKRPRDSDGEDEDGEDNVEEDALRRAMEDNPELAKEFEGKLQQKLGQARAATEKDAGNRAFASKQYKEAVEHFTKCIELDPGAILELLQPVGA
mmetsp:Transcript_6366/g.16973  ORF Transcript_6366/g.16973 Transcript_6366/m.16973 type:complete len:188 (+) Transcript_6366:68-631(+)